MEITNTRLLGVRLMRFHTFGFLLLCALPFVLALDQTRSLIGLILENETFSQVPLIPLVSAFLIYENRNVIFSEISFEWRLGATLSTLGMVCIEIARFNPGHFVQVNQGCVFVLGIVLVWIGSFALFFGFHAFRTACFPLWFLLFTVSLPEPILSKTIFLLQKGSSEAAEAFFRVFGVPYLRQGFIFELPGITIRVAEECSGIRSTLALLITTVLAGYLFLRSSWRRLLLCLAVVPVAIVKNGLRIMALSTLSVYVNPAFLRGNLHHHGGIVFFILALVPLTVLLIWLQRGENPKRDAVGDA